MSVFNFIGCISVRIARWLSVKLFVVSFDNCSVLCSAIWNYSFSLSRFWYLKNRKNVGEEVAVLRRVEPDDVSFAVLAFLFVCVYWNWWLYPNLWFGSSVRVMLLLDKRIFIWMRWNNGFVRCWILFDNIWQVAWVNVNVVILLSGLWYDFTLTCPHSPIWSILPQSPEMMLFKQLLEFLLIVHFGARTN